MDRVENGGGWVGMMGAWRQENTSRGQTARPGDGGLTSSLARVYRARLVK